MDEFQQMDEPTQDGAVPKALNYSDVMQAGTPVGDMQIVTNLPNNGQTFSPSQTVSFSVNVPVNSFADFKRSYLKFKVNNTGGTNKIFLDRACGAVAIIDSIKILSPTGAVISDIQHYGALAAMLSDYSSPGHVDGSLNIIEGASKAPLGLAPIGTPTGTISNRTEIAHSTSKSFCHTLHGGLFNCDRLLPLGFVNGQLQIQIQLNTLGGGITVETSKATTWTASDWEFHIPVVRTDEAFNTNLRQLMGSGVNLNIHMKDWVNQQAVVSSGTVSTTNILLANRKRSVNAVFAMFRPSASLSEIVHESVSARRTCGVQAYQYSIAGVEMPSKQVTGSTTDIGEYMVNTMMALDKIGYGKSSSVATDANYYNATDTTNGSLAVYALDLDAYKGVLSGKNLSSAMPLIFKPTLSSGTGNHAAATGAVVCDVFSHFDAIMTLSGPTGSLTVSS